MSNECRLQAILPSACLFLLAGCMDGPDDSRDREARVDPGVRWEDPFGGKGVPDSGYLDGRTLIHFSRHEGKILWQGDIMLDPKRVTDLPVAAKQSGTGRNDFQGRWPNGKIPYVIDASLSSPVRTRLLNAMGYWHARSNFRFFPRTGEVEYVVFADADGCMTSSVGRTPGANLLVQLGANCFSQNIQHEIGHVIGFHHEQSRTDRDQYVIVYPDRMEDDNCRHQYKLYTETAPFDGINHGAFDFQSIMLYSSFMCSKDISRPSMTKLDGSSVHGGTEPSGGDYAAARYAYSRKQSSRRRDFTGDGLNDLMYLDWRNASASITRAVTMDNPFQWVGTWVAPHTFYNLHQGEFRVGNFNNDNLADLVYLEPSGALKVKLNTGSGFGSEQLWGTTETGTAMHSLIYIGDFNGDGLDDVGAAYSELENPANANSFKVFLSNGGDFWNGPITYLNPNAMGTMRTGQYLVGYFNQDNKADLMWIGNAGDIHVRMSNGAGLDGLQDWTGPGEFFSLNRGGDYLVGDLTCDGKDDLLYVDPIDRTGWVAASTGSGLAPEQNWIPSGTFGDRAKGEYLVGMHTEPRLGKLCADVLFIQEDGKVIGKKSNGTSLGPTKTYVNAGAFGRLVDGGQYH